MNASTADLHPAACVVCLLDQHKSNGRLALAATLVLLLDLQIETVATKINRYWSWRDGGPYYGVPTANFVAWWLIGLVMALVVATILSRGWDGGGRSADRQPGSYTARLAAHVSRRLPA